MVASLGRDWHRQLPKPDVPKQLAASGCMGNHESSPGELASSASHVQNRGVARLSSMLMHRI
jgi:hypothetical protein